MKEAFKLKEFARKSTKNFYTFIDASKKIEEAVDLCQKFLISKSRTHEQKYKIQVLAEYYSSEKNDCLYEYYREKKDFDKAHKYIDANIEHLNKAIDLINYIPSHFSTKTKNYLNSFLNAWQYFVDNSETKKVSLEAKRAFNNKDFITALDYYRRAAKSLKKLISKAGTIDPIYERIAKGNYIGMMASASSSLAFIIFKKVSEDGKLSSSDFPIDLSLKLLRYTFDAYLFADRAYKENPEWDQYYEGSQLCLKNIRSFLKQNPQHWDSIFVEFENEPGFLKTMKDLDPKLFSKSKIKHVAVDNKIVKVWAIGSFFLLTFLIIIGVLIFLLTQFPMWEILIVVAVAEIISVIIGAFLLRTIGDLSEENFVSLIKVALEQQLKISKSFRSKNNT
ncbi:MAG: hypothetical protein QQN41_03630 [Nitrosopumilus sp.]